jgi:phosphoglycerate dehydrogenase-like enzyme
MSPRDSGLATARSSPEDRPSVLVWHDRAPEYVEALRRLLPDTDIDGWSTHGRAHGASGAAVLLAWRLPPGAFRHLPALRWMQATGAGVDHLLQRSDLDESVLLTRSLGRFGIQVAEYVVGVLLEHLIGISAYRRDQQARRWRPRPRPLLADCTVGIVGLGTLGKGVCDRLAALGVEVLGVSRSGSGPDSADEIHGADDWRGILPRCQALVLAAPLTHTTRGMIDAEAIAEMRDDAVLVNVARGEIVDREAVLEALRDGRLGAAVLDVFEHEPLDPEDPMWAEPRALITPHVAAPSEIVPIAEEFAANYRRYVSGEPLEHVVDRARGY